MSEEIPPGVTTATIKVNSALELGPLFTKERFKELREQYDKVMKNGGKFEFHDMHGQLIQSEVGAPCSDETQDYEIAVIFHSYHYMGDESKVWTMNKKRPCHSCPFDFKLAGRARESCFELEIMKTNLMVMQTIWPHLEMCKMLKKEFEANANKIARVDRIVCFGLRCLDPARGDPPQFQGLIRHLAACEIRDILATHQKNAHGKKPQVYVQNRDQLDTWYCPNAIKLLQEELNIDVINSPGGFELLDNHTFVISLDPNIPVTQIIPEITSTSGPPAGVLCRKMRQFANGNYEDGTHYDGKSFQYDASKRRGPQLTEFVSYSYDEYSPAATAYLSKCSKFRVDDLDDVIMPRAFEETKDEPTELYLYETVGQDS